MNYCGNCGACCKVYPIPGFKEGGVWCQHFKPGKGCIIHDGNRPAICERYSCGWLRLRIGCDNAKASFPTALDQCRPDRLKMLFWYADAVSEFDDGLPGETVLAGAELTPGARCDRRAREFMAVLLENESCVSRWIIHHFESGFLSWKRIRE